MASSRERRRQSVYKDVRGIMENARALYDGAEDWLTENNITGQVNCRNGARFLLRANNEFGEAAGRAAAGSSFKHGKAVQRTLFDRMVSVEDLFERACLINPRLAVRGARSRRSR